MSTTVVNILNKYGGIVSKIYAASDLLYKQFYKNEQDANEVYRAIYPSLRLTFGRYGRDSNEFNQLLQILAKNAPSGAKCSNFKRKYITNKEGWRQLPKNPNSIPFGYWW